MRGTWQTTDSGSGLGVIVGLAVVGVIGYAVYEVAEFIASIIVAVLIGTAVVTAAAVTGLVVVLRHQRGRTHLDAPQWVTQRLGAPPVRSSAAVPARPAPAIQARPQPAIGAPAVHYHLHLHAAAAVEHQQEHHNAAPLTSAQVSAERSGDQASPIRP